MFVYFFITHSNSFFLWYIAGLYLLTIGLYLFLKDGDIIVGFLWVIDFGVGLVFFIFIIHLTTFFYTRVIVEYSSTVAIHALWVVILTYLFFLYFTFYSVEVPVIAPDANFFFLLLWYDYYKIFFMFYKSELNLLYNMYFSIALWEFIIINFMVLYVLLVLIFFFFFIKRYTITLNWSYLYFIKSITKLTVYMFLRTQNIITQQRVTMGSKLWKKKKN